MANINAGNDLATLTRHESVGQVCESNQVGELVGLAAALFERVFAVGRAVRQVVGALE